MAIFMGCMVSLGYDSYNWATNALAIWRVPSKKWTPTG
jgi:hypothetical protein